MASNDCLPQVQLIRLRVALLDPSDAYAVDAGAGNVYVTDSMIRLAWSPLYTDGTEIDQLNGAGVSCSNYKADDTFKRINLTLELCSPNPVLVALLTAGPTLTDLGDATRPLGFALPALGPVSSRSVSLEWFTVRNNDGVPDGDFPYEWFAAPLTRGWRLGDRTHENGPQNVILTGQGYENGQWGDGPNNDWPVASTRVIQHVPALAAELPAASCEAVAALAS